MAPATSSQSSRPGGLSLYANLLDPAPAQDAAPGTISRAPVVFKQPGTGDLQVDQASVEKQQQISAASLRFQPTKRPQLAAQKPKSKTPLQKQSAPTPPVPANPSELQNTTARAAPKTTIADWTAEADENDVNGFYGGEKRQRGGRKKRKKNKEESHVPQNWDDIYDPSRPNTYEDYKHSEEKVMEIREWKDRLYAHRMAKTRDSDSDSSEEPFKPGLKSQFAPPGMSFAPPPTFDDSDKPQSEPQTLGIPDDQAGEDAYARRVRLSGLNNPNAVPAPPPLPHGSPSHSPPPPPPNPQAAPDTTKPSMPAPSIMRAPVRYNLPSAPTEIPASEAELESALNMDEIEEETPPEAEAAPRSLRPGQKGFAERLMSKYGWNKGSGLGASGSGIVNPLRVQVEKQKKKPDSKGGGFVGPGGMGKIVGGKKKGGTGAESQEGKFGAMSEVVILRGMVDGMDLDDELEGSGQGGLMQEIGEECGEKYGRVERVFIDRSDTFKTPVFVKFTSQLSALRAVNALEGRIFNGNIIVARFFDTEKFESGIYQ